MQTIPEDETTETQQKTNGEYISALSKIRFIPWTKQKIEDSVDGKIRFKVKDIKREMGPEFQKMNDQDFYLAIEYLFDHQLSGENLVIDIGEHMDGDRLMIMWIEYPPVKIMTAKEKTTFTFENHNPEWKDKGRKWLDFAAAKYEEWSKLGPFEQTDASRYKKYPVACLPQVKYDVNFSYYQEFKEHPVKAYSKIVQKINMEEITPSRCEPANLYIDSSGSFEIQGIIDGWIEIQEERRDMMGLGNRTGKLHTNEFSMWLWYKSKEYRQASMNMIYNLLMVADKIFDPPE